MADEVTSRSVPEDDVEFTVRQFLRDEPDRIEVINNHDGTYDIVATFTARS